MPIGLMSVFLRIVQHEWCVSETGALPAKAEEPGARIVKPAQKPFWGGYSGYFATLTVSSGGSRTTRSGNWMKKEMCGYKPFFAFRCLVSKVKHR
jgi:hypothetical protein